ncbi:hypothetical protein FHR20_002281 [Sphingomonas leidyi]|uniref:Putative DNA-binding domain-containing protein n=1 Tax=Sphingomonas leidyi TaxID=68569 RepID=A0A7X5UZW3_9SPHN|nr:DNA-binding domain-containing protein [Sphingomonas leidyi]NIJ65319.1 hypothetical protein [Sphingomonas leidyi]
MTLIDLQRDMRAWLAREDDAAATRLGGEDAAPGLRVHRNNFRASLAACLEESFARTRDWIGDEAFARAVAAHILRVPPSSWTLDAYPRDFPPTLALLYPGDPEVAELAWIDFALGEAFVGPDAAALTAADITEVDWDAAVLHFTPTLDLRDLTTNATAIWSALAEGVEPPGVAYLPEQGAILVWREAETAHFRAIDQIERQALLAARAGLSFADLCAELVDRFGQEDGTSRAGEMLGQWLADRLIVAISHSDDDAPHQ